MIQPKPEKQKITRGKSFLGVDTTQDFNLVTEYHGYRNKEDKTNLPPGYLVEGSKNVLTTTGGRVGIRQGYTLDGQSDSTIAGILSSYDWETHLNNIINLRAGNSKLQFRYVASAGDYYKGIALTAGQVIWADLLTSTSSNYFNFCDYWDSTNLIAKVLFVNGESNINEWTGGITTFASATSNTITKQGTTTWAEEGFYTTGTHSVVINGTNYQATGGWGTTTLTGVTPDPTSAGHTVGELVFQKVETTANSAMTSIATRANDLISNLRNQIYVGCLEARSVYVSKVNDYKTYTFTSPVRVVGEGALLTLDANAVGLVPQEDSMYISAGKDQWYNTKFVLSSDNSKEDIQVIRLKTSAQQGAFSQAAITKVKNSAVFITNEPTMDELGRVINILGTPQTTNMSDPIRLDFDKYDFTDCSTFYFRNFIYVAIPREGIVRVYNIIKGWWEAPQILPISRFSIIDGELYGHSYNTPETYKLFDGWNDNGKSYEAVANFSYQNYGLRANTKYFNEFYVEGYIDQNTKINLGIKYEIDGKATTTSYEINGSDTQVVAIRPTNASLGKSAIGKNPLGGDLELTASTDLPPKFRVIKTMPRNDFYEAQFSFSSIGIDYRWEVLAFGGLVTKTFYGNNAIKQ